MTSAGRSIPKRTNRAARFTAPMGSASGSSASMTTEPPGTTSLASRAKALRRRRSRSRPRASTSGLGPARSVMRAESKATPSSSRRSIAASSSSRTAESQPRSTIAAIIEANPSGPGESGPVGRSEAPSDQPARPIEPTPSPWASRIDRREQAGGPLPRSTGDADGPDPAGRVAGQGLADPGQGHPAVVDDHLEPAGLGASPLDHHARRAMLQGPGDEVMAVAPLAPEGHEDLAGVELPGVGGAAGDLPVLAALEPGLGQESPQADRGNPTLRGSIEEPSGHGLRLLASLGWVIQSARIGPAARRHASPGSLGGATRGHPDLSGAGRIFGRVSKKDNARLNRRPILAN